MEAGVVTTSTHKSEEKTEGIAVSNSAVLRDPEHTELISTRLSHPSICLLSQAAHSSPHSHVKEGVPQNVVFQSAYTFNLNQPLALTALKPFLIYCPSALFPIPFKEFFFSQKRLVVWASFLRKSASTTPKMSQLKQNHGRNVTILVSVTNLSGQMAVKVLYFPESSLSLGMT